MDYSKPIKTTTDSDLQSLLTVRVDSWKLYLGISLMVLSLILLMLSSLATSATLLPVQSLSWLETVIGASVGMAVLAAFLVSGFTMMLLLTALVERTPAMSEASSGSMSSNVYDLKPSLQRTSAKRADDFDELTGLYTINAFRRALDNRWFDAQNSRESTCIITFDVDDFRSYNQQNGRAAGDHLLCAAARSLSLLIASNGGMMARYGGEEFIAFVPGLSGDEGCELATRLRRAMISLEFAKPGPRRGFVTACLGVAAAVPQQGVRPADLIEAADRGLYSAKQQGRNRVALARVRGNDYPNYNVLDIARAG